SETLASGFWSMRPEDRSGNSRAAWAARGGAWGGALAQSTTPTTTSTTASTEPPPRIKPCCQRFSDELIGDLVGAAASNEGTTEMEADGVARATALPGAAALWRAVRAATPLNVLRRRSSYARF